METLGHWLEERLQRDHLSLRQAAIRTGLSHATIADIIKGVQPCCETIQKLVQAFGGGGQQKLALEDCLLTLAGYRTERPEGENISKGEAWAHLIDKVGGFSDHQLEIMVRFADFLIKIDNQGE